MEIYRIPLEDLLKELQTSAEGLSEEEARGRLEKFGPNRLAEEKRTSRLTVFLRQFKSPLIYILLVAAAVTALMRDFVDTGVILAVLLFNAVIGFFQEVKAEESVRALRKLVVSKARVVRGGVEKEIPGEELVPGDRVLLSSGGKVPADLRLAATLELRVDESMLTGESLPAEKNIRVPEEDNLPAGDQRNMAFMGTVVVNGRAQGVVTATGAHTVLGRIARDVEEAETAQAPLQEKIHRFSNRIGVLVLGASVLLIAVGIAIGESLKDMFMTAVAAAVATIPEGLPVALTIALAVGVKRMARRNAIVRRLAAVETLGSTTVICTDKTGTLTQNEMTVKVVYDGEHVFELTGSGYDPRGKILHEWTPATEKEKKHLLMALRVGLLCNESSLFEEGGEWKVNGDPTEGALIASAMKWGLDPAEERKKFPQIALLPFESERGYMATLHRDGQRNLILVKGGLEKVLDLCVSCADSQPVRTREILQTANGFAAEGMRVLTMAYKEAPADLRELGHADVEGDLILAGIQGMMDPPRPEAVEAVRGCKKAGIRVVMITGDHPTTAQAIGRMIGIGDGEAEALTGKEVEVLTDEDLFARAKEVSVYARVSPHHKLRITQQLQKQGEVVAVTGDGVNDAPALKAAHIGVAMGKSGTDVAKESADMVITDDNFATIFHAVEEGRIVFDNIRKVIFFLIPTGVAAIVSILISIFLGLPIPYTPSQLLWINLVTNGFQVIALTFEPGERGVVLRPPRDPREGIMSRVLIERTVLVGLLISVGVIYKFIETLGEGASLEGARTAAVTTMVFFQFFQAVNSRSETESVFQRTPFGNPILAYGLAASILAHLGSIYLAPLQWVFRTEPIGGMEWLKIIAIASSVILAVEADKWLRRRK